MIARNLRIDPEIVFSCMSSLMGLGFFYISIPRPSDEFQFLLHFFCLPNSFAGSVKPDDNSFSRTSGYLFMLLDLPIHSLRKAPCLSRCSRRTYYYQTRKRSIPPAPYILEKVREEALTRPLY